MNDLSWETNLSYELSEEEKATVPVFQAEAARLRLRGQAGDGRTYIRAGRVVRQRVRSATQPQPLRDCGLGGGPWLLGSFRPPHALGRPAATSARTWAARPARAPGAMHLHVTWPARNSIHLHAGRLQERTDEDGRPLLLLQRCNGDRVCIDGFDPMDL